MKKQVLLTLSLIVLLTLSGCSKKYIPVNNTSGFTVENMTLIERLEGTNDIYLEKDLGNVANNVTDFIWLYQVDNNIDENYKYVVALELTIDPQKYDISSVTVSISYSEDVQFVYDESMFEMNGNSYDLNYEDQGCSITGHVNVGDYFQAVNHFLNDSEGKDYFNFSYKYYSGRNLSLHNDYSKDTTMQKALFVLTSATPLTSVKEDLIMKIGKKSLWIE